MFVGNAMSRQVDTVTPDDTVSTAWDLMREKGYEALPVRDKITRKLAGFITASDMVELSMSVDSVKAAKSTSISDVMVKDITTISEEEILEEAARIMYRNDYYALPVTSGEGNLVGIITQADLGRMLIQMMGFTTPGSRITMSVPDRMGMLADIAGVVKACGESIASIATLTHDDTAVGNVVLRLRTQKPRRVVERLRESGYRVIHVSQEWDE